jgi:hypothetical protein
MFWMNACSALITRAAAVLMAGLLGLDGFSVFAAADAGGELELLVETTADLVGCPGCGAGSRQAFWPHRSS